MSVIFKINKLGPITNSSIEMKPFMIFSGESSMGKSYAAFLTYYLQKVFDPSIGKSRLSRFVDERLDSETTLFEETEGSLFKFSIQDICDYLKQDAIAYLRYLTGYNETEVDIDLIFNSKEDVFEVKYRKEIIATSESGSQEKIYIQVNNGTAFFLGPWDIHEDIAFAIEIYFSYLVLSNARPQRAFIFPPSRGGFVSASFSSLKAVTANSGMYQDFVDGMERILQPKADPFQPDADILEHFANILGGAILNEKGNLFYEFQEKKIPITASASSIKELAPLFLLLNKYSPKDLSVLFEEPESHLHPQLHVKIANLITLSVNKGASFQVTTHSDYFLTQINNLIKLHYLQSKLDNQTYSDFCTKNGFNQELVLDPKTVGAYFFKRRSDNSVEIVNQEITEGIPFDTFSDVINKSMRASLNIDNLIEEIGYDS